MAIHDTASAIPYPISEKSVSAILEDLYEAGVIVSSPDDVRRYLFTHDHVAAALPSLVERARLELGADASLMLEIDCSSGPGNEYLVLVLRCPDYDESILETLSDLTKSARASMSIPERQFIVTTDFVHTS